MQAAGTRNVWVPREGCWVPLEGRLCGGWGVGPPSVIMGTVQGGFTSGAASGLTFTSIVWRPRDMRTEGRRTEAGSLL